VAVADEQVVVTAGATGGFAIVFGAIVSPGAEVLILSPAWPLIDGITRTFDGVPVHVPWLGEGIAADDVATVLDRHRTERTVAVYLNTPSNPTGRILSPEVVEAIARWAVDRDVWLVSDEVYEDVRWGGPHAYARTFAPERTISAWSFSKAYGMAGNRVGYVVGPTEVIAAARKLATYTFYCAPHVAQVAGRLALGPAGEAWVKDAAALYQRIGAEAAARLGLPAPDGGTFLFFDLRPFVGDEPMDAFLDRCTDHGLLLAPGDAFGPWPHHVRLCFTAVEPGRTRRGIETLAAVLGR
jgi:N-succinyldiaminopimelate aminotransferase